MSLLESHLSPVGLSANDCRTALPWKVHTPLLKCIALLFGGEGEKLCGIIEEWKV